MTIDEYIAALHQAIRSLPPDEANQALAYYDEYLHDAADPAAAMAQLGTPKEVAANILAGYVARTSGKPNLNVLWAVVLGILAAPIAAPIAIVVFCVVLAALITVLAIVVSLFAVGVATCISGIAVTVTGVAVLFQHLPTGLTLLGSGLVAAAIGLLWTYGMAQVGRLSVTGLAKLVVRFTTRRAS